MISSSCFLLSIELLDSSSSPSSWGLVLALLVLTPCLQELKLLMTQLMERFRDGNTLMHMHVLNVLDISTLHVGVDNGALPSQQIPVESVESLDEPPLVVHVDGFLHSLPPIPTLALAVGQYVVIVRF